MLTFIANICLRCNLSCSMSFKSSYGKFYGWTRPIFIWIVRITRIIAQFGQDEIDISKCHYTFFICNGVERTYCYINFEFFLTRLYKPVNNQITIHIVIGAIRDSGTLGNASCFNNSVYGGRCSFKDYSLGESNSLQLFLWRCNRQQLFFVQLSLLNHHIRLHATVDRESLQKLGLLQKSYSSTWVLK